MFPRCYVVWLISLTITAVHGQTDFVASWNFEGNRNGNSNSPNVSVSSLNLSAGINQAGFPAGATGDAVSLGGWPINGSSADLNQYVEFSVTPQTYQFSVTSLSFNFNRSKTGPTQFIVRSNQDGFGNNIGSATTDTIGFASKNIGISFNDLETEVKFRIYGYGGSNANGTLRLDNLRVNGKVALVPLPVELLYFKAQFIDNQVKMSWETAWERNAQSFEVQRSHDAQEFGTLQTIAATGDTRERTQYSFTDLNPLVGTNYYRLRQTDRDGTFAYSKIVAAKPESDEAALFIYGNSTAPNQIRLRLQNLQAEHLQLFALNGQAIPFEITALSAEDFLLKIQTFLPNACYVLTAQSGPKRLSKKLYLSE